MVGVEGEILKERAPGSGISSKLGVSGFTGIKENENFLKE